LAAKSFLDAIPVPPLPSFVALPHLADLQGRLRALARVLRQKADVLVLRGLLALEQGSVDEAEAAFREALAVWQGGLDFNGRPVAQGYLTWIETARR
jgi:hypothetical protein